MHVGQARHLRCFDQFLLLDEHDADTLKALKHPSHGWSLCGFLSWSGTVAPVSPNR